MARAAKKDLETLRSFLSECGVALRTSGDESTLDELRAMYERTLMLVSIPDDDLPAMAAKSTRQDNWQTVRLRCFHGAPISHSAKCMLMAPSRKVPARGTLPSTTARLTSMPAGHRVLIWNAG